MSCGGAGGRGGRMERCTRGQRGEELDLVSVGRKGEQTQREFDSPNYLLV